MLSSAKPFVVFALFLCGLAESALSHSGRCTRTQCFAVFVDSTDYAGAQKSCRPFSGQLFKDNLTILTDIFTGLPSGKFWLEQKEEAVETPQTCLAVSTEGPLTQTRVPCRQTLSGYLCQYPLQDPCDEWEPARGSRVTYTVWPMAFEVRDSHAFPQGTTAKVMAAESRHLESKHICFSGRWQKAPWNCDVMDGGCEHDCNKTTNTCRCPAGRSLSGNGVTCEADPCSRCAQLCRLEGDAHVCACKEGYRLKADGRSCEDVDECEDGHRCSGAGQECVNEEGGFACRCRDGFAMEEGACVNTSICFKCEHMLCVKPKGFYECACREGFQVRATDPTKCDRHCTESQCATICDRNSEGQMQCFCPTGYILDHSNDSSICIDINECEMGATCEHECVNTYGGFGCSCSEGFILHDEYRCLRMDDDDDEEAGSAPAAPYPIPATAQPALVPPYIKAGSALGIAVFLLLCAALLFFLIHSSLKRCRRFDLTAFKHPNIDIFHLQQVTTETYKRLSF